MKQYIEAQITIDTGQKINVRYYNKYFDHTHIDGTCVDHFEYLSELVSETGYLSNFVVASGDYDWKEYARAYCEANKINVDNQLKLL